MESTSTPILDSAVLDSFAERLGWESFVTMSADRSGCYASGRDPSDGSRRAFWRSGASTAEALVEALSDYGIETA